MTQQNIHTATNVRGALLAPLRFAYGIYAMAAFMVMALCTLLATLFLPGVQRRRAAARAGARAFLWVAGMPLTVRYLDRLPDGQCVVVSNHASYIYGVVFTADLPPPLLFVIHRQHNPLPLARRGALSAGEGRPPMPLPYPAHAFAVSSRGI